MKTFVLRIYFNILNTRNTTKNERIHVRKNVLDGMIQRKREKDHKKTAGRRNESEQETEVNGTEDTDDD